MPLPLFQHVTPPSEIKVYALRAKASLFGHNYPGIPVSFSPTNGIRDSQALVAVVPTGGNPFWTLYIPVPLKQFWPPDLVKDDEAEGLPKIALDPQNEQLQQGGWVVIERPELKPVLHLQRAGQRRASLPETRAGGRSHPHRR